MTFFLDLIAQSYLQYVIDGEKEIAHFYSQEYHKLSEVSNFEDINFKATFYEKLCTEIGSLIIETYSNVPFEEIEPSEVMNFLVFTKLPNNLPNNSVSNNIKKDDFNNGDKLLFKIYSDEIVQKVPNQVNWKDCNTIQKLFSQIYLNKITLEDPIVIIHPSKTISHKPLVLRKSNLDYLMSEAERAKTTNQTKKIQDNKTSPYKSTVNSIKELFNNLDNELEWKFVFEDEEDFNEFVDLLALNLEQKPINLPEKIFKLKKRTKTKVSAILKSIFDELSNDDILKNSTDYFDIIKLLSHFENMSYSKIYKSLTK